MMVCTKRLFYLFCVMSVFVGFAVYAGEGDEKTYRGLSIKPYESLPYLSSLQQKVNLIGANNRKEYTKDLALFESKSHFNDLIKFTFEDMYYQLNILGSPVVMIRPAGAQVTVQDDRRSYSLELGGVDDNAGKDGTIKQLIGRIYDSFNTLVNIDILQPDCRLCVEPGSFIDVVEAVRQNNQINRTDKYLENYQKVKHAEDEVLPRICRAIFTMNKGLRGSPTRANEVILRLATGLGWYKAYLEAVYEKKHHELIENALAKPLLQLPSVNIPLRKEHSASPSIINHSVQNNPSNAVQPADNAFNKKYVLAALVLFGGSFLYWLCFLKK